MRDALQNLEEKKTSREHLFLCVTLNGLSETVLWEAKAICEMTSLRVLVTVLALFYESVKRRTKTKEIEKQQ